MAKKKQSSNFVGLALIGLIGFGIFQFGILDSPDRPGTSRPQPAASVSTTPARPASIPLDAPRFVNVASLNVRHTPSTSGPLVTTLPRGTQLKVLDRQNGWLLVDLSPTLEGWVTERLTTHEAPKQAFRPPAALANSR